MSYLNRISNALVGSKSVVKQLGWIGDSICINNFLGPAGKGTTNQKLGFASIVSSYYGAFSNNQAESGRILSSFLPALNGAVGGATAEFDGQWLNDGGQWYWWDPRDGGSWIAVPNNGAATSRNATSTAKLNVLLANYTVRHIFIAQSGANDNTANNDAGAGDSGAHGSYHYALLQNEIIRRIQEANKVAIVVAGTTASDPNFHGTAVDLRQEEIGRFSEAARQSALGKGVNCCDVGLRLNIELGFGRVDILARNSHVKPTDQTQAEWNAYLASVGDPSGANPYRSFDETEDELHRNDTTRASYFHNVHPNAFGHYLIANEIIKFVNENGLK